MPDNAPEDDVPAAKAIAAPAAPEQPSEFPELLAEYVATLSGQDARVELVNAFFAEMRRVGPPRAVRSQYDALYAAFQNAPA